MRRKVLVGLGVIAVSLGGLSVAAYAQEDGVTQWGGFYGGAHAGYRWGIPDATTEGEVEKLYDLVPDLGSRKAVDAVLEAAEVPLGFDGFAGGVHAGYNLQFKYFVLGVEGAYDWGKGQDTVDLTPEAKLNSTVADAIEDGDTSIGNSAVVRFQSDISGVASLRGRAGFTNGSYLLYGTGGVAWADYDLNISAKAVEGYSDGAFHLSKSLTGWVAGGGVEFKLTRNISVRGEVLHYDFGSIEYSIEDEGAFEELAGKQAVKFDEVHIGASYHLN